MLQVYISMWEPYDTQISRGVYCEGTLERRSFRAVFGEANWFMIEPVDPGTSKWPCTAHLPSEVHEDDEPADILCEHIHAWRLQGEWEFQLENVVWEYGPDFSSWSWGDLIPA